jgi:hypothetical protein
VNKRNTPQDHCKACAGTALGVFPCVIPYSLKPRVWGYLRRATQETGRGDSRSRHFSPMFQPMIPMAVEGTGNLAIVNTGARHLTPAVFRETQLAEPGGPRWKGKSGRAPLMPQTSEHLLTQTCGFEEVGPLKPAWLLPIVVVSRRAL